jgi:hypothetical protein
MLAGDADEVSDQAELLLKERPLSAYYDEVVVGGLRLALADRRRGALTRSALEGIVDSTRDLIESLADHDDAEPEERDEPAEPAPPSIAERALPDPPPPAPPARTGVSVLCLAGSGPADAAIAAMLVQLLEKQDQRPVLAEASAAGDDLAAPPDVICLTGAEYRGSSPRWRAMEANARRRWPKARIVRGLLRPGRASDEGCCSTLRAAVEACAAG